MKIYEMKTCLGDIQARHAGAIVLNFPDESSAAILTEGTALTVLQINKKSGSIAATFEEKFVSACKKSGFEKWNPEERDAMLVFRGIAEELFGEMEEALEDYAEILASITDEYNKGKNELTDEEIGSLLKDEQ